MSLEKIRKEEKPKFNLERFLENFQKLAAESGLEFTVLWLQDGNNLTARGWSNSPEGLVMSQVLEKYLDANMDWIMADIEEAISPKTPGMKDSVEAEFSTEE